MANPVKLLGKGIAYVGMGSIFLMAVIGTVAIDIVFYKAFAKESRRHGSKDFVTGYFLGLMWNTNNPSYYKDTGLMLVLSPLFTAIAVVLSFVLGVPEIGIALVAGWIGAFAIGGLGLAVYGLGDVCENLLVSNLFSRRQDHASTYTDRAGYTPRAQSYPSGGQPHTANNPWSSQAHFPKPMTSTPPPFNPTFHQIPEEQPPAYTLNPTT